MLKNKIDFFIKRHLKYPFFKTFCLASHILGTFINKKSLPGKNISKILVIQIGGIGDIIRLFPCLLTLHKEFPDASIFTLTQYGNEVFRFLPNYSEIISRNIIFEPQKGHKSIKNKLSLATSLKRESFDLIFSPNYGLGMIEFAVISYIIGSPHRIGYDYRGAGDLYTNNIELKTDVPLILQHLDLLASVGIESCYEDAEKWFCVPDEDLIFARSFLEKNKVAEDDFIITIAPIIIADRDYKSPMHRRSLVDYRAWPEDRYIGLIKNILETYKANVVILGDKISNGLLSEYLANSKEPNLINAIGQTTIGQSAALIKLSNLFIGNDSGLLHIAVALKKRCIGIFGSTLPKQVIYPLDYCITLWKGLPCSPCFIHQPIPDFKCHRNMECLGSITVDDVLEAMKPLMLP